MSLIEVVDYIDADVAYLLGLITARGRISESGDTKRIIIEFPYQSLQVDGISGSFDTNTSIRLGLQQIQERILELTGADVTITNKDNSVSLVLRFFRNTMVWRNILMHTQERTGYEHFLVPQIFFSPDVPKDWKREYIKGFADVAGNIRRANRYIDGANRVRLDVLNYQTNWEMPVQLCTVLEEHLTTPVQLITWGHPNMGRDFREHQINIFAVPFGEIGFSLPHKQTILEQFIEHDREHHPKKSYNTNSDNKSLINICRVAVGGASLPRLFRLNAQNAQNQIARWVSDRNATFLFRNGITLVLAEKNCGSGSRKTKEKAMKNWITA